MSFRIAFLALLTIFLSSCDMCGFLWYRTAVINNFEASAQYKGESISAYETHKDNEYWPSEHLFNLTSVENNTNFVAITTDIQYSGINYYQRIMTKLYVKDMASISIDTDSAYVSLDGKRHTVSVDEKVSSGEGTSGKTRYNTYNLGVTTDFVSGIEYVNSKYIIARSLKPSTAVIHRGEKKIYNNAYGTEFLSNFSPVIITLFLDAPKNMNAVEIYIPIEVNGEIVRISYAFEMDVVTMRRKECKGGFGGLP